MEGRIEGGRKGRGGKVNERGVERRERMWWCKRQNVDIGEEMGSRRMKEEREREE